MTPMLLFKGDFLESPMEIREKALSEVYYSDNGNYKGFRTKPYRPVWMKQAFERLLGIEISDWDDQPYNGVFQVVGSNAPVVYHCDSQKYAAMIYLNPDAPADSGTRLLRHKGTKQTFLSEESAKSQGKSYAELNREMFPNGYYDGSQYEELARVSGQFNHLCLFTAQHIHAAVPYSGPVVEVVDGYLSNLDKGRLTWLFFFN